jgi:hypothetical protein
MLLADYFDWRIREFGIALNCGTAFGLCFFADFTFAHRRFCAARMRASPAAEVLRLPRVG